MQKPAAFLDRDGVINVDHGHVGEIDRIQYIPRALECIAYLNQLGFFIFIVTNQAGIAKGKYSLQDYNLVMKKIFDDLKKLCQKQNIYTPIKTKTEFCGRHIQDQ